MIFMPYKNKLMCLYVSYSCLASVYIPFDRI